MNYKERMFLKELQGLLIKYGVKFQGRDYCYDGSGGCDLIEVLEDPTIKGVDGKIELTLGAEFTADDLGNIINFQNYRLGHWKP